MSEDIRTLTDEKLAAVSGGCEVDPPTCIVRHMNGTIATVLDIIDAAKASAPCHK
jgi:bacteriocin-like protein